MKIRIWEIDFLRGIALLLMVYYHIVYDLDVLFGFNVDCGSTLNFLSGRTAALMFMILAGVSSNLSKSNLQRGAKVLGVAMAMTVVTHLAETAFDVRGVGIKFGVLHFLGTAMIISALFKKTPAYVPLIFSAISFLIGIKIRGMRLDYRFLFPLGITYPGFASSDYYPLFPWIGFFFAGTCLGKILYKEKKSLFKFLIPPNPINFLGRRALVVYVIHQPAILLVIFLISKGMGR